MSRSVGGGILVQGGEMNKDTEPLHEFPSDPHLGKLRCASLCRAAHLPQNCMSPDLAQ